MIDRDCVELLQWMLPRLHLRWAGFRRVRKQVCKRFERRFAQLGIDNARAYRRHLLEHPEELALADELCRVTISRFNRDRDVFAYLAHEVLPRLAERALTHGDARLRAWSAGCASGEEPYTLALFWHYLLAPRRLDIEFQVLGTDVDDTLLRRARQACYRASSLKELCAAWLAGAFEDTDNGYCLKPAITRYVGFAKHDIRSGPPDGEFDLVLCRNLAFTYFDDMSQRATADVLCRSLRDGGALVLGAHEKLPPDVAGFAAWSSSHGIYRKLTESSQRREHRRLR